MNKIKHSFERYNDLVTESILIPNRMIVIISFGNQNATDILLQYKFSVTESVDSNMHNCGINTFIDKTGFNNTNRETKRRYQTFR